MPDSPSAEVNTPGSADPTGGGRYMEPARSDTFPNKDKKLVYMNAVLRDKANILGLQKRGLFLEPI